MRGFIIIFGIYILFLSVFPAFITTSSEDSKIHCKSSTCPFAKEYENKSEGEKSNNSSKQCTPFFGCAKMQIILPPFTVLPVKITSFVNTIPTSIKLYFYDPYTTIWHPPKTA